MRLYLVGLLVISLFSCKSQSKIAFQHLKQGNYNIADCFKDRKCSLEILPNSSLIFATDEFNNSYIEIKPGTNTLLKYRYKRNEIPGTADTNYEELLFIELNNQNEEINLKDSALQEVKMTYGRLCYCKGTSGYFKVTNGTLQVKVKQKELHLKTNFEIKNIPQLLNLIDLKVALN